jgi:aspartyl-tRNA(Asn)/glutamyl-tRNA(Gln) amidotransferase subunit B
VSDYEAGILTADRATAGFFEEAARASGKAKAVSNWIVNELNKVLNENKLSMKDTKATPQALVDLLAIIESGSITTASGKEVLAEAVLTGKAPRQIVADRGLAIVTDAGAIESAVDKVIASNAKAVADFKGGKDATIKFLVGQVMKETRGRVKAQQAEELLRKKLS